jgi:superfamily II DNA or RNA helicase
MNILFQYKMDRVSLTAKSVDELRKLYRQLEVKKYNGIDVKGLKKDGIVDALVKFESRRKRTTGKKSSPKKSAQKTPPKKSAPKKAVATGYNYTRTELRTMTAPQVREIYDRVFGGPRVNKPEMIDKLAGPARATVRKTTGKKTTEKKEPSKKPSPKKPSPRKPSPKKPSPKKPSPRKPSPKSYSGIKPAKRKLVLFNYSKLSFAVYGETEKWKTELKALKGKYNSKLAGGPGWIFYNSLRPDVEVFVNAVNEGNADPMNEVLKARLERLKSGTPTQPELPPPVTKPVPVPSTKTKINVEELSCVQRSKIMLKGHQKELIEHMLRNRGAVAVHPTGTGKTLLAGAASQCVLDQHPDWKVVVITPKSLQINFKNTLKEYGVTDFSRYEFHTPHKFGNMYEKGEVHCSAKTFLIIDEAHKLRTHVAATAGKNPSKGRMTRSIIACSAKAGKVLLLTATPIFNEPYDVENLVAMVKGIPPLSDLMFTRMVNNENKTEFKQRYSCVFSFYDMTPEELLNFPRKVEENVRFTMTPSYLKQYEAVEESNSELLNYEKPFAFLTVVREATNAFEPCQKCDWTLKKIREGKKTVVYSAFKEYGINKIQARMKQLGLKYVELTGKLTMKQRAAAVEQFNDPNGPNVLFITKAGSEGIDLKRVRNVILLEKGYNREEEEQVIGRAARYQSHIDLPDKDQQVNVYYLILSKPAGEYNHESADDKLVKIIEGKNRLNRWFIRLLRQLSIEKLNC